MIPAKEFDGELWIKAADHHQEVKRMMDAERTAIYDIVMIAPFKCGMSDDDFEGDKGDSVKAMAFQIGSEIRARGNT